MNMVVCVKQVIDPELPLSLFKIDPQANRVIPPRGRSPVLNPFDENALEAALKIKDVEEGKEYALLLSSCAGAWRYLVGDTIKFTSKERSEIVITGRTKHFLSLCGEHLSQENMNRAIQMLEDEFNIEVREFTVAGIKYETMFAHKWYIGTDNQIAPDIVKNKIDEYLKILNDDYRVERIAAIKEVLVEIIPSEIFYKWMKMKGKEGAQNKFPRVLKNEKLIDWETFLSENRKM